MAAYDLYLQQRNSTDSATDTKTLSAPNGKGLVTVLDDGTLTYTQIGPNLLIDSGWLDVNGFHNVCFNGDYYELNQLPYIPNNLQRLRVQTNSSGAYTWTFDRVYDVPPVIQVTVEDPTAGNMWNHRITALSETAVTIQLAKSTAVTILGISVLGIAASPQAYVHLVAMNP